MDPLNRDFLIGIIIVFILIIFILSLRIGTLSNRISTLGHRTDLNSDLWASSQRQINLLEEIYKNEDKIVKILGEEVKLLDAKATIHNKMVWSSLQHIRSEIQDLRGKGEKKDDGSKT